MKKNIALISKAARATGASLIAITLIAAFCSFRYVVATTDELWRQLGITQQDGVDNIRNSFLNGYFSYTGVKNITNMATGNRVAITKDLLAYAKQYVGSRNFQNEYEKNRQQYKPVMPAPTVRSLEDIRKEQIAGVEKQIATTEGIIKNGNAEMKKIMQPVLEIHKKNLKEYQAPNSKTVTMLYQDQLLKQQQDSAQYQKAFKNWQANYPADYRQMVKQRLQYYVDIASTVDFSAALKAEGHKMKFVNNVYEGKNNDWKMVYRAGKEVNEAVISFSRAWILELSR